ncbi:MAG: hypothetical protein ABR950_06070 [Candidatus Dormibacteria bacterium]|jgi:hypothetical protein
MPNRLMVNPVVHPSFAQRSPFDIRARTLGLVLMILGTLAALVSLLFVTGVAGLCNGLILCTYPTVDVLGTAIMMIGWVVATAGFALMFMLHPHGPAWAVYGLMLAALGDVLSFVGDVVFVGANPLYYGLGKGAIAIFIFWLLICAVFYYLVVASRPETPPAP